MKPVFQFPIPPLHPPSIIKSSSSSSVAAPIDRREVDASEPLPKRIRLDENDSSIANNNNNNNNEAQHSNNVINNVFNRLIIGPFNTQEPQLQRATLEVA